MVIYSINFLKENQINCDTAVESDFIITSESPRSRKFFTTPDTERRNQFLSRFFYELKEDLGFGYLDIYL